MTVLRGENALCESIYARYNMWCAAQQEKTGKISWCVVDLLIAAAMHPLSVVENAGFGIVSARPIAMAGDCFSFVIIQI